MKCEQISRRSLWGLVALGLILASSAAALSAPPARRPAPRPGVRLHPAPYATAHAKAVPRRYPGTRIRTVPRARYPVVVPRYRPRPVIRAGAAAVVIRGSTRVIAPAPPAVFTPAELAVVPTRKPAQAKAYQVASVSDDYGVTLMIYGKPTRVRLLGVEPPLVAPAEGQPGVLPEEALRFVRNLLVGELVYLESDPRLAASDADGVRVAYLHRAPDGLLVNLEIIRQGYGLTAEAYSFQHQDAFAAYQTRARQTGKGIWRGLEGTGD